MSSYTFTLIIESLVYYSVFLLHVAGITDLLNYLYIFNKNTNEVCKSIMTLFGSTFIYVIN